MLYLWLTAYVLAVLLANIFLDTFIPLPWFGLLSLGTVFFAAVFTLRDRLHQYGLRPVLWAIALALLVNTLYSHFFGTPTRFLIASFASILISELAATVTFQKLKHRSWPIKALCSNAVGVPLDSTAFTLLAFWGVLSPGIMTQIIFADVLAKFSIAAVMVWQPRRRAALLFNKPKKA
ncbi:MAG: VUT family protein [Neisseriaceae bacterium]|nr:VUT family protein [Neisseriaceae bacterium]MBP6862878.1 VUT family protein [Neisseriaceae bacterium]